MYQGLVVTIVRNNRLDLAAWCPQDPIGDSCCPNPKSWLLLDRFLTLIDFSWSTDPVGSALRPYIGNRYTPYAHDPLELFVNPLWTTGPLHTASNWNSTSWRLPADSPVARRRAVPLMRCVYSWSKVHDKVQ